MSGDLLVLEGESLRVSLLPRRGADIYELVLRASGQDTLFKASWGRRPPASGLGSAASFTGWFDSYSGGWCVLFPNGGAPCEVLGAELPFHGEASLATWEVLSASEREARLEARLVRSPLRIERWLTVDERRPVLTVRERVMNEGRQPYPYLWAHHPTLGADLLEGPCRIDTSARSVHVDAGYDLPGNALVPGAESEWPIVEGRDGPVDLSAVPPPGEERSLLAYLSEFEEGWYAVSNEAAGLGFALRWPVETFPCAWFWQELNASPGYPWYQAARTIAIEPSTTFPADGLAAAIEAGRSRTLQPGESHEVTIVASLFRPAGRVRYVDADGDVQFETDS
jgi:hypothetical protein